MFPILSGLIFLPLLGAVAILLIPGRKESFIRAAALITTGSMLALAVVLLAVFNYADSSMQFVEQAPWIPKIQAWYFLGVDGISVILVFLTALLGFLACVSSLTITHRVKEYFLFYLLLMVGMTGTFLALDLLLFYIFWEVVLIPMYFLIGIWGGPRREYAAMKFFLYTLAGSVLMLIGILATYFLAQPHTLNILELGRLTPVFGLHLQIILFLAFAVAFAIKVPFFPFHTWLPDAHVEAPTPVSVLLAGVLLKMGGYGFLRIAFPLFTEAAQYFAYPLAVLAAVNIIYGACVAMAQTDFKKMIAYSSVSHMGFVMLGLASMNVTGFNGALMGMFNHGIITGGMFLLVGVLYERTHTRELSHFGGLSARMPVYAFFLTVMTLASLGLPGLSGFVGEFLSLVGGFSVYPVVTAVSALGLVLTAAYFLLMIKQVLLGTLKSSCARLADLRTAEVISLAPLLVLAFIVGICPMTVLKFQESAVQALVKMILAS